MRKKNIMFKVIPVVIGLIWIVVVLGIVFLAIRPEIIGEFAGRILNGFKEVSN